MGKGGDFERNTAKDISLWATLGERDDCVWHTHGSGGRATQRKKAGKDTKYQYGDLTFTDDCVKWLFDKLSFELKTGYAKKTKTEEGTKQVNWCALDILDSKQKEPTLVAMWNQCERDAELSNREPVLIFRRNNKMRCVCIDEFLFGTLQGICGFVPKPLIKINFSTNSLCIFRFEDFFKWTENLPIIWNKSKRRRK